LSKSQLSQLARKPTQTPRSGLERARVIDELWRLMEGRRVPWLYPFEIHLLTEEELKILEKDRMLRVL